jgi:hypothetical protein
LTTPFISLKREEANKFERIISSRGTNIRLKSPYGNESERLAGEILKKIEDRADELCGGLVLELDGTLFCELMAAERKRKKRRRRRERVGGSAVHRVGSLLGEEEEATSRKRNSSRTTGPKEATTHTGQEEGKRAGESERDL